MDDFIPVSAEEISEEKKQEIIEKIARGIANRGMIAPAIMFLETIKPVNFLGSQLMIFLEPIILSIFNISQYREIALMFEQRETVEKILIALEKIENENKNNKSKNKHPKED